MRKIFLFMTLSLDGYFEGPDHDISWHNVDDEFAQFAIEQLKEADTFLFGRRIYQLMEDSWPKIAEDPTASSTNRETAYLMNNTNKIVFSRTLTKVEEKENWRNVKLYREFDPEEIRRLKNEPGKDMSLGGSDLAISFIKEGLVDEFRFVIVPVIVGEGTHIFQGLGSKLDLKLTRTRTFRSGNVLLCYEPAKIDGPPV